jgi:hypothetical protein
LFVLNDLELNATNRWIVEFSKDDYVTTQKIVESSDNQLSYSLNVMMTVPDVTKLVDLTQEQTINLNQNQLSITLPSNAVKGGDDNSSVSLTYGDPSSARGKELFPGDYSATNDLAKSPDIILESIGFMDISITSETGQDLSELSVPADVTLRLPSIYQVGGEKSSVYSQGDTIPWWSYNETEGTWLREDADPSTEVLDNAVIEEVEGVLYAKAQITHFSWWNVDQPIDQHACVSVKLVDNSGNPQASRPVFAEGISFQFTDSTLTNSQGIASLTVKRTLDTGNPETFKLYTHIGSATFSYQVTSLNEGIVSSDVLYSPTIIGSTIVGTEGACAVLSNEISTELKGTINATVKNQDNTVAENILVYSSLGDSALTDAAGKFSFKVPLNSNVYIIIPEQFSKSYITTEANKTISVDIILTNQSPVITQVKLTPNTEIKNGDSITLSAQATDPEGDDLTYTWSASLGSLSSFNGTSVNWTAPLESGSGEIILTVKDSENNKVMHRSFVSWSDQNLLDDEFTVRARIGSDVSNSNNIAGITVVLHAIDNIGIDQVRTTDEDGVANFGKLSRDRVTITIIEEYVDKYFDGGDVEGEVHYDVQTHINIVKSPISFQVKGDMNNPYIDCNLDNSIAAEIKFINIPENTDYIRATGLTIPRHDAEENKVITVSVCPGFYNNPSNFIVAVAGSSVDYSTVFGHSQPVYSFDEDGITTFDLSKRMIEIPVVSNLKYPVNLGVYSIDKSIQSLGIYDPLNFATVKVMDLDIDNYHFRTDSYFDEINYNLSWTTEELPESIVIENPNVELGNVDFNRSNKEFSWDIISNDDADVITSQLESTYVYWSFSTSPTSVNIKIPQLPAAYDDVINFNMLIPESISILDTHSLNGFDAIIERHLYDDDDHPTFIDYWKSSQSNVSYKFNLNLN